MKKTLTASLLAAGLGLGAASPALAIGHEEAAGQPEAWTPGELQAALKAMPEGDVTRGERLNDTMMCSSCHGDKGETWSRNWTDLAGQRSEYTYKMLLDYRNALRAEGTAQAGLMQYVAAPLSKQEMADLAAYYESLPLPKAEMDVEVSEDIEKLVRQGDPERLITPCAACHGRKGQGGINETPALAGQEEAYFIRTMQAYKDGSRDNDVNNGMAIFAEQLTDEEIEALADYYAGLGSE